MYPSVKRMKVQNPVGRMKVKACNVNTSLTLSLLEHDDYCSKMFVANEKKMSSNDAHLRSHDLLSSAENE